MPLMMIMMIIDMMMIITMRIIMMMIVMMIIIMIIIMVIIMVGLRLFEGGFDRDVSTYTPIKNGRLKNAGLRATTGGR